MTADRNTAPRRRSAASGASKLRGMRAALALLVTVVAGLALVVPTLTRAAPAVSGSATSSVAPCLQVGSAYLSTANPNVYEQDVYLYWTGTITSARLIGYEFNTAGSAGRNIKINGTQIGTATGTRNSQTQCRGFEGLDPLSWTISNPAILKQGKNTLRIEIDPARTSDTSWGISRAQIEVTGVDVDGRHYRQVTIPSSYFNNWQGYANEGTWTHIMEPQGYDSSKATPLLISVHGFGSNGWESMLDYHDAAATRGWLLASADLHGEVWNDFMVTDSTTGLPAAGVGRRTMGSRASQWDIADILAYMQSHYNVDPTRIYLVGHSMGGMTALLTGARYADRFAAVVSDSGPTDLAVWEDETQSEDPKGATENPSINHAIRAEAGTYKEPTHAPDQLRQAPDYPFEFERRSPVQWAANYEHLPLWILHPDSDKKVLPHHAEDMYLRATQVNPDHVERTYFPGVHGDRINGANFANTQLDWLAQFTRPVGDATQPLNFSLDWSGSHFWIAATMSGASLNEAHWLRVSNARYDRRLQTIDLDVENVKPQNGDQYALGVPAPKNMPVTLTFDLTRIGLLASGTYTVERINKDDGTFTVEYPTASNGKVQVTVPQGGHIIRLSAGGTPPTLKTLSLRQGVDGYTGSQDTFLSEWEPDTNLASRSYTQVWIDRYRPNQASLFRFDLSRLPSNAKVRSAVLSVAIAGTYPSYALSAQTDAVARAWNVGEATWNRASNAALWTEPGASNVPADRKGAISDTRLIYPASAVADRYGFNVTDIVKGWVADPASNLGVTLRAYAIEGTYGPGKTGFTLNSSEAGTVNRRPMLTIVYTTDEYTPTPTNTATPTATATSTATPTATPPVGPISGVVFLDDNRNGQRDTGEAGVSGRLVQLKRDGVVRDNVTTGSDGRYNFATVEPGAWQVTLSAPPSYGVTTAWGNPATVTVNGSDRLAVDFGLALGVTVTPTPTATRTPCPQCQRDYLPLILQGGN